MGIINKSLTERLDFGKMKGSIIEFAIQDDVKYIQWCVENRHLRLDKEARSYLAEMLTTDGWGDEAPFEEYECW